VDLAAENERDRITIEVETGKHDTVSNIRKCLGAGFDRVVCVTLNERTYMTVHAHPVAKLDHVEVRRSMALT